MQDASYCSQFKQTKQTMVHNALVQTIYICAFAWVQQEFQAIAFSVKLCQPTYIPELK